MHIFQITSPLYSMSYYLVLCILLKLQIFILVVSGLSLQISSLTCIKETMFQPQQLLLSIVLAQKSCIYFLNSSCLDILESIAPLKYRSQPWLDDSTHSLRQICQKAKRRWKKDYLTVSLEIFINCLVNFQKAAKKARGKYFSDFISKYSNTP